MGGIASLAGWDRGHPADSDRRPVDARCANAFHHSGRLLHHGLCIRLLEQARRRYRFQDAGHYALRADRSAGLSVRANHHHYFRDLATRAKWRRDGAFRGVPEYLRLDWGFGRARHDHRADTVPSILSRPMGEPFHQPFNELIARSERTLTAMG